MIASRRSTGEGGASVGAGAEGKTTQHALGALEVRGVLFSGPSTDVYEGMIVGEHSRDSDLEVRMTPSKVPPVLSVSQRPCASDIPIS